MAGSVEAGEVAVDAGVGEESLVELEELSYVVRASEVVVRIVRARCTGVFQLAWSIRW